MTSKVIKAGLWRAEILIGDIGVPFHIELINDEGRLRAFYINEPERMEVEEVIYNDNSTIEFNFPSYSSSLLAHIDGERMSGQISFHRPDSIRTLNFYAEYGKAYRFHPDNIPQHEITANFSGIWQTWIEYSDTGEALQYIANLTQKGSRLSGCFESPYGDSRFLSGDVKGNEFYMSMHDGGLVQYCYGKLGHDGSLSGHITNLGFIAALWKATPINSETASAIHESSHLKTDNKVTELDFQIPDINGRLLSLSDKKYSGKVLILIFAASWCPTCHDHAAFFAPYFKEFNDQGLEAISLMFESSPLWKDVKEQVIAFKRRYQIDYDMAFAGDQSSRNELIPQLKQIVTFPTLVLIGRDGKIRKIWPSFSGPATGINHQAYVRNFKQLTGQLLSESSA